MAPAVEGLILKLFFDTRPAGYSPTIVGQPPDNQDAKEHQEHDFSEQRPGWRRDNLNSY